MLRQAVDLSATVAPARATVLIVGEQGTGKSLIARSIHQQSGRRDQPFLEVSCGGIDELGLEREIFGQRFEGEAAERPGRLARAHRGTLLLDEVASLSPTLQTKLLRVLIDGEFEPMGSNQPIPIDVRFVLATRENLPALVEQGRFRRDLFERINDICLKLPPLRQRGHDVILLAEYFRDRFARDYGKPVVGFSPDAQDLLLRHDWPGNVRELESVIQRGVALSQGPRVTSANLAVGIAPARNSRPSAYTPRLHMHGGLGGLRPLKEALEEPEKQIIIAALRALNWNRQETARVLDINRTTLYKKMKKYGLLIEEPALLN
jgi:two-component system response regulator HydG